CASLLAAAALAASALAGSRSARALPAAVTIGIDASANRHPIDPRIYGVAYATPEQLQELNAPLNRYGGHKASRDNWQLNADNRGQDWYFESIAEPSAAPGERGDRIVTDSRAGGAQPMLTIPTIGWVAKVAPDRGKLSSFSIRKYGAQSGNDW